MNTVTYKGKEYPTRTLIVSIEGEEREITLATQALSDAMGDDKEVEDTEANDIDCTIYFYVDNDEILEMDGRVLCERWLDEPMEFIEDEGGNEPLYTIQDLDGDNKADLQKWVDTDKLFALIDEKEGGIIGYINHAHGKRIMDLLNEIPYLKANLRKLN